MKTLFLQSFLSLTVLLSMSNCALGAHSPTLDVLGSYFPAWMVCIILGLVLTVVVRQLLTGFKLNAHLRPAALVYVCMTVLFTLAVWLMCYKN